MLVTSSLSFLFQRHLPSRQLTRLFRPNIPLHSHLRKVALSLRSKSYPTAGSYSLAPPYGDPTTCSLFANLVSLKPVSTKHKAVFHGMTRRSRSPDSQGMHWRRKLCVRRRTFTLREPKGKRCMVLLSSHTDGKRAIQRSGRDCCSFTGVGRWPTYSTGDVE